MVDNRFGKTTGAIMARDTFESHVGELKKQILVLGSEAKQMIQDGVESLKARDRVLARAIIERC
jgi:phosphate uptake regulator